MTRSTLNYAFNRNARQCRQSGRHCNCRKVLVGYAMVFHVTLDKAEDGWVVAECPALPGCVSQGKDEQEALANIKEAIAAWLWAEDQKAIVSDPHRKRPEILVSL